MIAKKPFPSFNRILHILSGICTFLTLPFVVFMTITAQGIGFLIGVSLLMLSITAYATTGIYQHLLQNNPYKASTNQ